MKSSFKASKDEMLPLQQKKAKSPHHQHITHEKGCNGVLNC